MYTTRGCTPGVPTVYPYPQYPWLTQPEGRRVRVLTGTGTGQPGITRGLPVLIPNWDFNDTYAKVLIANNVTTTQMMYIKQTQNSHENWCNLEAIHDAKSHQTTIGII